MEFFIVTLSATAFLSSKNGVGIESEIIRVCGMLGGIVRVDVELADERFNVFIEIRRKGRH